MFRGCLEFDESGTSTATSSNTGATKTSGTDSGSHSANGHGNQPPTSGGASPPKTGTGTQPPTAQPMASGQAEGSHEQPWYNDGWGDWLNPFAYWAAMQARSAETGEAIVEAAVALKEESANAGVEKEPSIARQAQAVSCPSYFPSSFLSRLLFPLALQLRAHVVGSCERGMRGDAHEHRC